MNRRIKIIRILVKQKKAITIDEISKELKVSNRTIRTALKGVNDIVVNYNLELIRRPRVGIWLAGEKVDLKRLEIDSLSNFSSSSINTTRENRMNYMLLVLLDYGSPGYIDQFAKELFVSRSTVEKDLQELGKWLLTQNLCLLKESQKGYYYITGKESDIRRVLFVRVSIKELGNGEVPFPTDTFYLLNLPKVDRIVQRWVYNCKFSLDETNEWNLVVHILILIKRVQGKNEVQEIESTIFDSCYDISKLNIMQLIKEIEQIFNIKLSDKERISLQVHVVGMLLNTSFIDAETLFVSRLHKLAKEIVEEFVEDVEKIVPLGLVENTIFKEDLVLHLMPTVYRCQNNLDLFNPLLNEIKENHMNVFVIAAIIQKSFQKWVGKKVNESEISLITLHLSLAIEKWKAKQRIAIICPMGKGVARYLSIRLKMIFPNVDMLNYSVAEMENGTIKDIDLILSTVNLRTTIPYTKISGIIKRNDVKKIKLLLCDDKGIGAHIFSKDMIHIFKRKQSMAQVLKFMSNCLEKNGYVDERFYEDVMKRKEMGPTEIGNGVVLIQGFYRSVKQTQISLAVLKNAIVNEKGRIQCVVLIAVCKEDVMDVLKMSWFYEMLKDKEVMGRMMRIMNKDIIYDDILNEKEKW